MKKATFSLLFLLCLGNGFLFAGINVSTIRLEGSDIEKGLIVKDKNYGLSSFDAGVWNRASLILGVDELYKGSLIGDYTANVTVDIKFYNSSGSITAVSGIDLDVVYDPIGGSTSYKTRDVYYRSNFYKMEVSIVSSPSSIPENLFLEAKIETKRFEELNTSPPDVDYLRISNAGTFGTVNTGSLNSGDQAVELMWEHVEGAEYYELEYSYIDNYQYNLVSESVTYTTASQTFLSAEDFKSNNTRVITSHSFYRLPAIYPRGFLVYRVRAVGFESNNLVQPIFGNWSGPSSPTTVGSWTNSYVKIDGQPDINKNYQVVTTFAEDGKKKEVMSFYDGSNRQRQTITRLNSIEKTVVGESYYDYIGRQSLVLLPVPDASDVLHYKEDFNTVGSNYPAPSMYDVDIASNCVEVNLQFDTANGASNYYSIHNNYSNFTAGIPDANGYVYSKTVYKRDNTGRIKYQSTSGEEFRPGERNTEYYYTKPSQNEISSLFGDNVGADNHYKKNVVIDPNGQASISYLNPAGKTIATALDGETPTGMDALLSNDPDTTTYYVIGQTSNNNYFSDAYTLESSEPIAVTTKQDYIFTYDITGDFQLDLSCVQDMNIPLELSIQLIDECGEEIFLDFYNNLSISNTYNYTKTITNLEKGSYLLTKKLIINASDLDQLYTAYIYDLETSCFTLNNFLDINANNYMLPCDLCDSIDANPDYTCLSEIQTTYGISINTSTSPYSITVNTDNNLPQSFFDDNDSIIQGDVDNYITQVLDECETWIENCDSILPNSPGTISILTQLLSDVGLYGQYGGEKLHGINSAQFLFEDPNGLEHLDDITSVWCSAYQGVSSIVYDNIYNKIYEDVVAANDYAFYSWKSPRIPFTREPGYYLNELGQRYKIYIQYSQSGEITPEWDEIGNISSDNNGYFIYPHQLAKVSDFKDYWQDNWSENLVAFHPEWSVYEFYDKLEDLSIYSASETQTSTEFDESLLADFIEDGINGPWADLTNPDANDLRNLLYDFTAEQLKDPFFNLDTIQLEAFGIGERGIQLEKYYHNYKTGMKRIVTNFNNSTTAVIPEGIDLGTSEIAANCYPTVIDLLDVVNYYKNCNTNTSVTNECDSMDLESPNNPNPIDIDLFYNYVTMYQSIKKTIIQKLAVRYADAVNNGFANYCIGDEENVYLSNPYNYSTYFLTYVFGNSAYDDNKFGPCTIEIKELFDQKQRRVLPDAGDDNDAMNQEEAFTNYTNQAESDVYDQTGLSMFTYTFTNLLEELCIENEVDNIGTSGVLIDQMQNNSPVSYFALIGQEISDALNNSSFSYTYSDLNFQTSLSSNILSIKIYGKNTSNTSTLLHTMQLSINPSTTLLWNQYSLSGTPSPTNWSITDFDMVVPDSPANGNLSIIANTSFGQQIILTLTLTYSILNPNLDLTPVPTEICSPSEFTYEYMGLLNFFGEQGSLNGLSHTFITPTNNITNLGSLTLADSLDHMAYYRLQQSPHLLALLNELEPSNLAISIKHAAPFFILTKGSKDLKLKQINGPSISSNLVFDGASFTSSTYLYSSSAWEYKGEVVFFDTTGGGSVPYSFELELRNTDHCDILGYCLSSRECIDCEELRNPSIPSHKFTDCCQPWFLPVVMTCNQAYDSYNYVLNNRPTDFPIFGFFNQDVAITRYPESSFCEGNIHLYWPEYLQYLNEFKIMGGLSFSIANQPMSPYALNPFFIDPFEFASLNFQDFMVEFDKYTDAILADALQIDSMDMAWLTRFSVLLENEYIYLNDANSTNIRYSDIEKLLTPAEFVALNLSPACIDAFLAQLSSTKYDIYEYLEIVGCQDNYPYCAPIVPLKFPTFPDPQDVDPCFVDFLGALDTANWTNQWEQQMQDSAANFYNQFLNQAFSGLSETLKYQYDKNTYHHTLYYYDLAGNLIQTVPPKGIDTSYANGNSSGAYPDHTYKTQYRYNTFNQLVWQSTPDGGETQFWYDKLGRLVASQNAQQLIDSPVKYSYTIYDDLGRISEVGVVSNTALKNMTYSDIQSEINGGTWPTLVNTASRSEIVMTYYDQKPMSWSLPSAMINGPGISLNQRNLRNRVAVTAVYDSYPPNPDTWFNTHSNATYYSYDIHGNVEWLVQDIPEIGSGLERFHYMEYEYDLISGNVKQVSYMPNMPDQFYHKYEYDDDNRITETYTSNNNIIWQNDSRYLYYDHGPLARTELGENKVQGQDYFYTLQGWLKGVNTNDLTASISDLGQDNLPSGLNPYASSDVYGFTLDYYDNDYSSIASSPGFNYSQSTLSNDLYNGNIKGMNVAITNPADDYSNPISSKMGSTSGQVPIEHKSYYSYDQLNRIENMNEVETDYRTTYAYDENGNLDTLIRYDADGAQFDLLTYHYENEKNRLNYVKEDAGNTSGNSNGSHDDILNQNTNNYEYDDIGNLTKDVSENINQIDWLANGKIKKIAKTNVAGNVDSEFLYDASGNRIVKNTKVRQSSSSYNSSLEETQYYIRDASGNVMASYKIIGSGNLKLTEHNIYGSSRIGVSQNDIQVSTPLPLHTSEFSSGEKIYELSNHLGNVMQTITDHKIAYTYSSNLRFGAEVTSMSDYFPFGMRMSSRSSNSSSYRYGYQGSELDDEIKGEGNSYTTHFRLLDPRIGRWLSVDPKAASLSWQSTFCSMDNNPILYNDPNGDKIRSHRKDRKGQEIKGVSSYEAKLASSLGEKTGLNLSFNKKGELEYERDENGKPVFSKGSEKARNDLIEGINDKSFNYDIAWHFGSEKVNGGQSTNKKLNSTFGYMNLDMADFSSKDPKTFDLGMVFLHEYNHGYFGLIDDYKSSESITGSKARLYGNTNYHKPGYQGETVIRVNEYRTQLNLPIRLSYDAIDGSILFQETNFSTNKKGVQIKKFRYFTLTRHD